MLRLRLALLGYQSLKCMDSIIANLAKRGRTGVSAKPTVHAKPYAKQKPAEAGSWELFSLRYECRATAVLSAGARPANFFLVEAPA